MYLWSRPPKGISSTDHIRVDICRTLPIRCHEVICQAEKLNAKFFILGPADVLKRYEREVEKAPFHRIKNKYRCRPYDELREMFLTATRYREVSDHFLG